MSSWTKMMSTELTGDNLLIVDMMNFSRSISSASSVEDFAKKLETSIRSFAKSYSCGKVVLLSDKGVSSYRKEILPEYKENRKKKREAMSEAQRAAEAEWFFMMRDAVDSLAGTFPLFKYQDVEADDMAALITDWAIDGEHVAEVFLLSTDGDWDTFLRERVSRFAFTTRKMFTVDNMFEEHGADSPEQFALLKAIQGDLGDNIRGIDGVGKKRGYSVIREFNSTAHFLDSIPDLVGSQKFICNIREGQDIIERNLLLVDLRSFAYDALVHAGVYDEFKSRVYSEVFGE